MAVNESDLAYAESTDPPSLHFWTKALADAVRDNMLETGAGARKRVAWGIISPSMSFTSGDGVFTHNLGWAPTTFILTPTPGTAMFTLGIKQSSITTTQVTFRAVVAAGVYTGSLSDIHWLAIE